MTGKPDADPELPNPDDFAAGVLGELKRHARVMRRMIERAMQPQVPGAPPENPPESSPKNAPKNAGNSSAEDSSAILRDDRSAGR